MIRILVLPLLIWASVAQAESELIMVEQDGCYWCEQWHEEIGHIYPKTWEAKLAPLRSVDMHRPLPDDVSLSRSAIFTPTFILLVDGQEAGRLEGYVGDEFFWALLDEMMRKAGLEPAPAG